MSVFRDFGSAARSNAAPVTTALVVLIVVSFVFSWMGRTGELYQQLAFAPALATSRPWTLLAYPFAIAPNGILTALFGGLWLWGIGGAVERDLGPAKYLGVWALFSALGACFVWIGAIVMHADSAFMAGPWNALAAITVIWGTRNPSVTMMFMFVIPIQGKWMAWLSAAFVFFGTNPPTVAPFGAIPYVLAYFFAANKIAFAPYSRGDLKYTKPAKKWERYDKSYYEEVQRREKDRAERDRLRKLFEGSIRDDDEK